MQSVAQTIVATAVWAAGGEAFLNASIRAAMFFAVFNGFDKGHVCFFLLLVVDVLGGTRLVRIPYRGYSHSDAVITARMKMKPMVSAISSIVSFFIGSISVEHFFDEAVSLGFGLRRA